jgi:hypothetical protein
MTFGVTSLPINNAMALAKVTRLFAVPTFFNAGETKSFSDYTSELRQGVPRQEAVQANACEDADAA